MKFGEIMTVGAECIQPEASLQRAAERMRMLDVGCLPVCDVYRLLGMITDRDIVLRAVARGYDPRMAVVRDAMTHDLVYCYDDHEVEQAADMMRKQQIRRLPVLNREMRLVGMLALGDIAVGAHDEEMAGMTLEAVSEPSLPIR